LAAPLNPDEVFKALLTALGASLAARLSAAFEVLTDPTSPRKTLEDAKQSLSVIDSWTKVMDQLNRLPPGATRDQLQVRLEGLLHQVSESQQQCVAESLDKRDRVLRLLSLLRLRAPQSFRKGVLAFLFYLSVILTGQSIHLYLTGTSLNPILIVILAVVSALLWAVSGSGLSPRSSVMGPSGGPASNLPQASSEPPHEQVR
jgi:hypothetical protein